MAVIRFECACELGSGLLQGLIEVLNTLSQGPIELVLCYLYLGTGMGRRPTPLQQVASSGRSILGSILMAHPLTTGQ